MITRPHRVEGADGSAMFEVFFDGACPLCRREIALLRRLDRERGSIVFTDIAARGFDPAPLGKTQEELMARIHGRLLPGGALVEGAEVFRRLYGAVGFGPLVSLSRVPPFSWAAEVGYRWFAKNRSWLTGRPVCNDQTCAVSADARPR